MAKTNGGLIVLRFAGNSSTGRAGFLSFAFRLALEGEQALGRRFIKRLPTTPAVVLHCVLDRAAPDAGIGDGTDIFDVLHRRVVPFFGTSDLLAAEARRQPDEVGDQDVILPSLRPRFATSGTVYRYFYRKIGCRPAGGQELSKPFKPGLQLTNVVADRRQLVASAV